MRINLLIMNPKKCWILEYFMNNLSKLLFYNHFNSFYNYLLVHFCRQLFHSQKYKIFSLDFHTTGRWFSLAALVSSTNKTDSHDITEIMLKVALNTINQPTKPYFCFLDVTFTTDLFFIIIEKKMVRSGNGMVVL